MFREVLPGLAMSQIISALHDSNCKSNPELAVTSALVRGRGRGSLTSAPQFILSGAAVSWRCHNLNHDRYSVNQSVRCELSRGAKPLRKENNNLENKEMMML